MTPAQQVQEKIAALKADMLSAHPRLPALLQDIHKMLKADTEIVTILTNEECGVIFLALEKQMNQSISVTAIKKTKSLKSIGLSDL